jgi:hypothetical protein
MKKEDRDVVIFIAMWMLVYTLLLVVGYFIIEMIKSI